MTTRLPVLLLIFAVAACGAPVAGPTSSAIDLAAAEAQARTFHTLATRDDWANYGAQFSRFCEVKFGFDCNRPDRDVADMSSAQEIQQWDSEKNNPQSVLADIGILFIPQAETVGIMADYQPPNANLLPDNLHGPGWVATFVGVPTIMVNVDALEARELAVPESWADLVDPAYAGMIGLTRVGVAAGGTWAFVAMNLAAGGTLDDWQPGIEYGRQLLPNLSQAATLETFERGETPIALRFDFASAAWVDALEAKGIRYRHIIPTDGSVYAPATLMLNRWDTAHHDFGKLFMEWVLTDEGQYLFAPSGAHPVRAVLGENRLVVPEEYRTNWLPDADYERVQWIDWEKIDSEAVLEMWENQVVGGS